MDRIWAPWRMSYIKTLNSEEGCIFCNAWSCDNDREKLVLERSEHSMVMLNLFPYTNGHMMAVPRKHTSSLDELSDDEMLDLMKSVRRARNLLQKVAHPDGFNIGINLGRGAGAGIDDHLHIHVVPRWVGDANFMTVIGDIRVIPEGVMVTYDQLFEALKSAK
jgi:ATP adenylyltransferase